MTQQQQPWPLPGMTQQQALMLQPGMPSGTQLVFPPNPPAPPPNTGVRAGHEAQPS